MKKTSLLLTLVLLAFTLQANAANEEEQIKKVIQTAYVDGLQNLGSIEEIEAGFHPGFNLLGVRDNLLTKFPIYSWVSRVKKQKKDNPEGRPEDRKITCRYQSIDVTGQAAMAKIELYRQDQKLFTDYLQLYKFKEGWRIVSKIYHRHE